MRGEGRAGRELERSGRDPRRLRRGGSVEAETSRPIANAKVDLGLPHVDETAYVTTGPEGLAFLPRVAAGERELVIVAEGYETLRERIELEPAARSLVRIGERRLVRSHPGR